MKKYLILSIVICLTITIDAQTNSNIKCKIWKPQSFCNIPDSLTGIWSSFCLVCASGSIPCTEIDTMENMTGVWLSIPINISNKFKLKSHFKNISLIKKSDGKIIHPYAMLESYSYEKDANVNREYFTSGLKAKVIL